MFLKKLYIGAGMVLGYLILRFKSWDGSMLFYAFHANSNTGACRKYKQNLDYVPNNWFFFNSLLKAKLFYN